MKLNKFILLFGLMIVFLWPQNIFAQSSEQITKFSANISINENSSIEVIEEINYYFSRPRHGIYRYLPYRYEDKDKKQYFNLDYQFLEITQDGQRVQYQKSKQNGNWVLKIGDPDVTISGAHLYKINYRVKYAISYFDDYDELYWNISGSGWDVPIQSVTAEIDMPIEIGKDNLQAKCYSQSLDSNCQIEKTNSQIIFNSPEPITVAITFPKGTVQEIEKPYRKILPFINYSYDSGWFLLLPLLFFIFMFWRWTKTGRDPKGKTTIAPEFEIPDNLTPAEMGVILDERAGNREISATFVSLIFKGYVKIEEVRTKGFFKRKDYELTLLKRDFSALKEYEKDLLEAFFVSWDNIKLSELKQKTDPQIKQNLDQAKERMYGIVAEKGFFVKSPQTVRSIYLGAGIGIFILGLGLIIVSAAFNIFSITLSIAILLIGIIYAIFSRFMPQKTRKGVLAREKILGFKMYMEKAEKYRAKWQEKENMITQFLPYAVLFGITSEWLKQLKAIGINVERVFDHSPYYFIPIYSLASIDSSLNNIGNKINTTTSSFSSSSSGFGGGSFGGGFGGGGGGSW